MVNRKRLLSSMVFLLWGVLELAFLAFCEDLTKSALHLGAPPPLIKRVLHQKVVP